MSHFFGKRIRFVGRVLQTTALLAIGALTVTVICLLILPNNQLRNYDQKYLRFEGIYDGVLSNLDEHSKVLPELMPRKESIFFVETSGSAMLELRQLCVIESAAKYHPQSQVYVLFTSPVIEFEFGEFLGQYKNVHLKYLHLPTLIHKTPVENLWNRSIIQSSQFLVSHLSDVVRFLLLQKYGGTYLDLDALILRPLPENVPNFVGRESWTHPFIAAGVMKFEKGHPILDKMVENMAVNFDGNDWGANGPRLVTRVLQDACSTPNLDQMTPERCMGVRVFPPDAFYPVPWREWRDFYDPSLIDKVESRLNQSYSAHLWGRHSGHISLEELAENQPLNKLARENCPMTFSLKFLVGN